MSGTVKFKPRAGQREFERGVGAHRICACIARRQYGKTTMSARIALKKMMKTAGHTVIFGSVKVDLGREIVRKEAAELHNTISMFASSMPASRLLDVVDESGKSVAAFKPDDFAKIYEDSRLEMRLYHSRSVYSRTKVVALTVDAVGETGDIILDEVERAKKFQDVWEAMKPIISSKRDYRAIMTLTPPVDDSHYTWPLLSPPVGFDPQPNPRGNWYQSELGIHCLRITAYDAWADGVALYDDDTGEALTPDESRKRDHDKSAWDRNYGCIFTIGGTSACGIAQLKTAQTRGIGQCAFFQIQEDSDMQQALHCLTGLLGPGRIGMGWDLATTTKATSNPSAFTVAEESGNDIFARGIFVWKTADPDIAAERARLIIKAVAQRKAGGSARRLCIDATNERYFAQTLRQEFAALVPVELVIASETVEVPGEKDPITLKQLMGGELVAELDDNHLVLPPERYIQEDWRLVRKEKGQFICEPDGEGRHGDTFDSTKNARRAIKSTGGAVESVEGWSFGHSATQRRAFMPRHLPTRLRSDATARQGRVAA